MAFRRVSILNAAMKRVAEDGVKSLTIRFVAYLDLVPNALYRLFESLAGLAAAVAEEEARLQMLEVMKKAAGSKGPMESNRAVSEEYLRFALEGPRTLALYLKASGTDSDSPLCTPQCARNTEFFLNR